MDLRQKRAIFFQRCHQIMQQFGQYHPQMATHLLTVYATSFYGSSLWSLASDEFGKLCKSWNTATRLIWDLPIGTHTRLLEAISTVPHLELVLESRYIGFVNGLNNSKKPIIKLLFNVVSSNLNTVTGSNISYLCGKHAIASISSLLESKHMLRNKQRRPLSQDELWKIDIIEDISLSKKGMIDLDFDPNDLEAILNNVCVS